MIDTHIQNILNLIDKQLLHEHMLLAKYEASQKEYDRHNQRILAYLQLLHRIYEYLKEHDIEIEKKKMLSSYIDHFNECKCIV